MLVHYLPVHFIISLYLLGKYALSVPRGLNVEFEVTYNNHTFKRINYADRQPTGNDAGYATSSEDVGEPREYFLMQQPTDKIDFEDVSVLNVTVELAGGLCNRTLPASTILFTRQPECGINFRMIRNLTSFSNVIALPAHRFDFTFGEMRSNLPTFNLAVRDYLIRANNNTGEFDLVNITDSSINRWARFEYHPLPTLAVSFNVSDTTKCDNGQSPSFLVVQNQAAAKAVIAVSESYPAGLSKKIDTCTYIQGVINVTNSLGEDNENVKLLNVCRQTCPLDIGFDATVKSKYTPVCAFNVREGQTATVACPDGGVIDSIEFARYGANSTGTCEGGYNNTGCVSGTSASVVRRECLGKESCEVSADSIVFGGNPCNSTFNALTIQAVCRSEYTIYENARVELELQIGYPNRISPYFKTLVSRMQVLGYINDIVIV